MKVRITRTENLNVSVLKNTFNLLLPFDGIMQFSEEKNPLLFHKDEFDWDEFFISCTEYRKKNNFVDNEFLVVLTELNNNRNWFSAFSLSGERTIFICASDWENYIYCEPEYPIAYHVVSNIFNCLAFKKLGFEILSHVHEITIGCMSDLCEWKSDITFKLRTGDICQDCLNLMLEITNEDHIKQAINIFESLRIKMLSNSNFQKPLSFEENLPFQVAITKRKVSTTLEPFRKLLMLIDHFDSIVRTSVIMVAHLSKPKEEIEQFISSNRLAKKPTLGLWIKALEILSQETIDFDWGFQLPSDFSEKVKKVIQLTSDNGIMEIRNEQRGHGYINCHDANYIRTFEEFLPVIDEMEKLMSPLFHRFKYYHVIDTRRIKGNEFRVRCYNLSGSNSAFVEEVISAIFNKVDEMPLENHFYLVSPDKNKWTDLHPYFSYSVCNVCKHNRLLVFDGIYTLDPFAGHRFETLI